MPELKTHMYSKQYIKKEDKGCCQCHVNEKGASNLHSDAEDLHDQSGYDITGTEMSYFQ